MIDINAESKHIQNTLTVSNKDFIAVESSKFPAVVW